MAATQVDKAQVPSKGQGVENQKDLTNIGFRVKLKEMPMIQDYVNRIYNQFVADPNTKEQRTPTRACRTPIFYIVSDKSYLIFKIQDILDWMPTMQSIFCVDLKRIKHLGITTQIRQWVWLWLHEGLEFRRTRK